MNNLISKTHTTSFFIALFLFNSITAFSQNPQLVKDICKLTENAVHPQHLVEYNGIAYFDLADNTHGEELWRSDGTKEGTYLLKDIYPGQNSSYPDFFVVAGNTLFFAASDNIYGREVWKTDGTPEGTIVVKDINPSVTDYCIPMIDLNGKLLMEIGFDLWLSDGTEAGTTFLANVNLNTFDVKKNMVIVNGVVYFSGSSSLDNYEFWRSDGTATGTYRVKDVNPGGNSSSPRYLVSINGTIYFSASDDAHGIELWKSDGTAIGTQLVKDIAPGVAQSEPSTLVNYNGTLFFSADDNSNGRELWKSDGTVTGTVMVKDINLGGSSNPGNLTVFNNLIIFSAGTGPEGTELWKSDGTSGGTILIKDIKQGTKSSTPYSFFNAGGTLYFNAVNSNKTDLMSTDGTVSGTVVVSDKFVLAPINLLDYDDKLLFAATKCECAYELWKSDGTSAGTKEVGEITNETASAVFNASSLTIGNTTYFSGEEGVTGADGGELWKTNGTSTGTKLVKDIEPGYFGGSPTYMISYKDLLYFKAYNPTYGAELWKSDGTEAGTVLVKDIFPGTQGSYPENLTVCNDTIFFTATTNISTYSLWKSDGTAAGTVRVDNNSEQHYNGLGTLIPFDGKLYFFALDVTKGWELYSSDGSAAGTVLLKDINPGPASSGVASHAGQFEISGGYLFFTAYTAAQGTELWKTDGTAAGTVMVKDIDPGNNADDVGPDKLTDVNGTLYFVATTNATGTELWISDGTAAGTVLVKDIVPGPDPNTPQELTNVNGMLFFNAGEPDQANNRELWKSDGTINGTVPVKLITSGGLDPQGLRSFNGLLYFSGNDGITGRELWVSDGTACGTQRLADIYPGLGSSNPVIINTFDNLLLFSAVQPETGRELWKYQDAGVPPSLKTFTSTTSFCPGDASTSTFDFSCDVNTDNVYTVQLSDASGSFTTPVSIGTLAGSISSGTIPVQIPNTASGSGYRIRTIASSPSTIGADNGNNLSITCPVPQNFQSSNVTPSAVTLTWADVSCAEKFQVRYRKTGTSQWLKVNAGSNSKKITSLQANTNYEAQVHSKCATAPDAFSDFTPSIFWTTAPLKEIISESTQVAFELSVFPNPMSDKATIKFSIQKSEPVKIELYGLQGKKIKTIAEGNFDAGNHWCVLQKESLSGGMYFLMMRTNSGSSVQKLTIQ